MGMGNYLYRVSAVLKLPVLLGVFGGLIILTMVFWTSFYLALSFALFLGACLFIQSWRSIIGYAEDGARVSKDRREQAFAVIIKDFGGEIQNVED